MLVKEIVSSILDLAKARTSDDSFFTEEFVIFLAKKYRSFLIKKEQEREKSTTDVASEFEYQQICLNLSKTASMDGVPCAGQLYLRSDEPLPKLLEGTQPRVYPVDFYGGVNVAYVSRDRMRFVGSNRYLRNIIYVSLGPDMHLYLKSDNAQFKYLKKLRVNAIFEDFDVAAEYLCDGDCVCTPCDVLDEEFPIREYLVPQLIDLVVKELTGAEYKPADKVNNSADELANVATKANK